jgi:hypothetical protein
VRTRQSVGRAVAFVFAALVSLPAQNLPEFSGVWQLNKEKSRVEVRMAWAKVELTDAIFSVNLRVLPERGGEETSDWHFTMGSSESSNLMHGAPVKSHVERDGGTVVVRSVTMFGSDRLNTIARWAASPDGQSLTYTENHQYANGTERDSVFVFDRRPATTWPAAQSQPAEKVFKNVRVLRSVAAEQVPAIMATFTRSLGVSVRTGMRLEISPPTRTLRRRRPERCWTW